MRIKRFVTPPDNCNGLDWTLERSVETYIMLLYTLCLYISYYILYVRCLFEACKMRDWILDPIRYLGLNLTESCCCLLIFEPYHPVTTSKQRWCWIRVTRLGVGWYSWLKFSCSFFLALSDSNNSLIYGREWANWDLLLPPTFYDYACQLAYTIE